MDAMLVTQYIVDEQGEKTGVIVRHDVWQKLLEDLHDLRIIAARRDESSVEMQEILGNLGVSQNEIQSETEAID